MTLLLFYLSNDLVFSSSFIVSRCRIWSSASSFSVLRPKHKLQFQDVGFVAPIVLSNLSKTQTLVLRCRICSSDSSFSVLHPKHKLLFKMQDLVRSQFLVLRSDRKLQFHDAGFVSPLVLSPYSVLNTNYSFKMQVLYLRQFFLRTPS